MVDSFDVGLGSSLWCTFLVRDFELDRQWENTLSDWTGIWADFFLHIAPLRRSYRDRLELHWRVLFLSFQVRWLLGLDVAMLHLVLWAMVEVEGGCKGNRERSLGCRGEVWVPLVGVWFVDCSMGGKSDLVVVGDRTRFLGSGGECVEVGSSTTNGTGQRHPSRVSFPPIQLELGKRSSEELRWFSARWLWGEIGELGRTVLFQPRLGWKFRVALSHIYREVWWWRVRRLWVSHECVAKRKWRWQYGK